MNICQTCKYWQRGKQVHWIDNKNETAKFYGEMPFHLQMDLTISKEIALLNEGVCSHSNMEGILLPRGVRWNYNGDPRGQALFTHIEFGCVNWEE